MCIIAYKPRGFELPSMETLANCMDNNPDGTGYMFNIPEGVFIRKGFDKPAGLLKALYKDLYHYNMKETGVEIAIHARIATAGLVKPENCHPFPITNNVGELQATSIIASRAMVHNGIISISDNKFKNLSDTQIFVKNVLSQVDLSNKAIREMVKMSIGSSKMLIFDKGGMRYSFGSWEKEKDLWFSNTTYKERSFYVNYGYGTKDYWKDWDDKYGVYDSKTKTWTKENTEKSYGVCHWCNSKLSPRTTAYISDTNRDMLGLEDGEKLCDDCFAMFKTDCLLVD